ncbi:MULTISPECIES: ScyD/ScyE family protein [unclassified Saccharothrix]|uniref:ScyD/ScyE family protein n=1 Tax=unclassified Saccharothrix TaxID=2593673 RepID=UPI00307F1591
MGAVVAAVLTPATAHAGGWTVVAEGLDNPRGLDVAPDGSLYVAEAGRGGAGPCFPSPEGGNACFGTSGAITRVNPHDKTAVRVLTGLPSIAAPDGSSAIGPSDVAFRPGKRGYVFTVGLGADPALRESLPDVGRDATGRLLTSHDGSWKTIADIAGHEAATNPDQGHVDSNPNSVYALKGSMIVVDAGGNSLLRVSPNGHVSTLAVFPSRTINGAEVQSVPTSVVRGPDGAYYVGELTGFPFPQGQARVHRVLPSGHSEVFAEGFTNIIDVAFDNKGRLHVLEIAHNGLTSGNPTGALIRVEHTGLQHIVALDGLTMPGGLTFDGNKAYITNCGVCPSGGHVVQLHHH